MIPRYNCPEISCLWNDHSKFKFYLDVELSLLSALESAGIAPKGCSQAIRAKAQINPERIAEIEAVTHHDVIAFCTSITENLPTDITRFFHYGTTSSDIIDTATNLQIKASLDLMCQKLKDYLKSLWKAAEKTEHLLGMGRSHGMNAEPIVYAQKFLNCFAEAARSYERLIYMKDHELTAQFSGAVGSYTVLNHEIEQNAADLLGLPVEPVGSQVIARDHIARIVGEIGVLATSMERLAVELRHLQHSDIAELAEGFKPGQKGSSTMPHKKNPISSENTTGMARLLRSYVTLAMENMVLWHERDISHSSAERVYLPDCFGFAYYALTRMSGVIDNLVYNEDKIEAKVKENSNYLSSYYLHMLLRNSDKARDELYKIVQEASFKCQENYGSLSQLLSDMVGQDIPAWHLSDMKKHYQNQYKKTKTRVQQRFEKIWD